MSLASSKTSVYSIILLYGLTHLIIDIASVNFYFKFLQSNYFTNPLHAYLLYAISAFAMQALLGFFSDLVNNPTFGAILGCIMVAIGPGLFIWSPITAFLCVGLGNAVFHVNGGIVCLSLSGGKATIPGLYVAPGTLGVMIGTILGLQKIFPGTAFVATFAIVIFLVLISGRTYNTAAKSMPSPQTSGVAKEKPSPIMVAILLFCACIILRSVVGTFSQAEPLRSLAPAFTVPVAVFAGKALGGFLADKFGWHVLGLTTLLLSTPLLFMAEVFPVLLVFGLFLFNMTMPITLAAVSNLLPGKPGLAFGLTALGLFIGAVMVLSIPYTVTRVFFAVILAGLLFHTAMRQYNKLCKS